MQTPSRRAPLAFAPFLLVAFAASLPGCRNHGQALKAGQGTFIPKVDGSGATAIAAGDAHTCAIFRDGSVRCWGSNWMGEASGTRSNGTNVREPSVVEGAKGAVQIAAAGAHTCTRAGDGDIACWGANTGGALDGKPSLGDRLGVRSAGVHAEDLSVGYGSTCGLVGGKGACWGEADYGRLSSPWVNNGPIGSTGLRNLQPPRPLEGVSGLRQISIGLNHGCGLLEDGAVSCWGLDNAGQLGRGDANRANDGAPPDRVLGLDGVAQIHASGFVTCALRIDGTAWCWGRNDQHALGTSVTSLPTRGGGPSSASPLRVEGLDRAIQVAVGGDHACAVTGGGRAFCWGHNDAGQLGDGTTEDRPTATAVVGLDGVAQIAVGTASKSSHTCALTRGGAVYCWGKNREGALGVGKDSLVPARVPL